MGSARSPQPPRRGDPSPSPRGTARDPEEAKAHPGKGEREVTPPPETAQQPLSENFINGKLAKVERWREETKKIEKKKLRRHKEEGRRKARLHLPISFLQYLPVSLSYSRSHKHSQHTLGMIRDPKPQQLFLA